MLRSRRFKEFIADAGNILKRADGALGFPPPNSSSIRGGGAGGKGKKRRPEELADEDEVASASAAEGSSGGGKGRSPAKRVNQSAPLDATADAAPAATAASAVAAETQGKKVRRKQKVAQLPDEEERGGRSDASA